MSVIWRGVELDERSALMMDEVARLADLAGLPTIVPSQGSYSVSVGASAGTHDGGGAIDISLTGWTDAQGDQLVALMRQVGWAAWRRTAAEGFVRHVHGIAVECPDLSPEALDQVTDYFQGRNGLANNQPDDGPREWVGQTWEGYLAGNPPPGGGPVFRGQILDPISVAVTAGTLDAATVFTQIQFRDDGLAATLNAGDEIVVRVEAAVLNAGDIIANIEWHLNISGTGQVHLEDGFDSGTGAAIKILVVSGSVILDWLCLQVEPYGGIQTPGPTVWSPYILPTFIRTGNQGDHTTYVYNTGGDARTVLDQDAAQASVNASAAAASSLFSATPWTPADTGDGTGDPIPDSFSNLETFSHMGVATNTNGSAVTLYMQMAGVRWGEWPDYRTTPAEITTGALGGTVVVDPVTHQPVWEFQPGVDTTSASWYLTALGAPGVFAYYEENGNSGGADGATGSIGFGANTGGTGPPASDPQVVITYGNQPIYGPPPLFEPTFPVAPITAPAGEDIFLVTNSTYTSGGLTTIAPDVGGWVGGPLEGSGSSSRTFHGITAAQINVQLPPFRYLIQTWLPPTTEPPTPTSARSYVRARQRRDGLGISVKAARSSHVLSARSAR